MNEKEKIFIDDSINLFKLVNKLVNVKLKSASHLDGWIYTIDPVSLWYLYISSISFLSDLITYCLFQIYKKKALFSSTWAGEEFAS